MKKFLSLSLALCLFLGLSLPVSAAGTFTDVPANNWAAPYIEKAASLKLVEGTGGGKFSPGTQVSYAQFATMLVSIKWKGELDDARNHGYDSTWWEPYCHVAQEHGLFDGTEMHDYFYWDFGAENPVNRADMAVIAYNFMKANGKTEGPGSVAAAGFTDIGNLYEDQANAVAYCVAADILSGTGDGKFSPDSNMTRAQAATVLCAIHSSLTGEAPVTPTQPEKPSGKPDGAVGGQYDTAKYSVPADANKDGWITEAEVQARIEELKIQYVPGTLWNDASIWGTDRNSADGYITSYGGHDQIHYYYSKAFRSRAYGCAAWAMLLSDRIFGNLPVRQFTDVYSIRPGDVIGDKLTPHWSVYTKVDPVSSDYMLTASSGSDKASTIGWYGSYASFTEVEGYVDGVNFILYTRYPAE